MMNLLAKGFNKVTRGMRRVSEDNRGASDLITIVGLIVVVLAVILIFKGQLTNIVNQLGGKVTDWINNG